MDLLDTIHDEIYASSIDLFYAPLRYKGITLDDNGDYYIGMDISKISNSREQVEVLTHELGHIKTGALYDECMPLQTRGRCEVIANKWAIMRCIPKGILSKLLKSNDDNIWEVSEKLGVTVDMVKQACGIYFGVHC